MENFLKLPGYSNIQPGLRITDLSDLRVLQVARTGGRKLEERVRQTQRQSYGQEAPSTAKYATKVGRVAQVRRQRKVKPGQAKS